MPPIRRQGAEGEVFVASSETEASLRRAVAAGRLRRLARGLYASDLTTPPEQLVRRNLWAIIAQLIPDALVVDRTAADLGRVGATGEVFLASKTRARDLVLPGHRISVRSGAPLEDDPPLRPGGPHIASLARALVDNLEPSRSRSGRLPRTLRPAEYEDWVAAMAAKYGEQGLNRIRERAKQVAAELGVPERVGEIDRVVGAALGTRELHPKGRPLAARRAGTPWDSDRLVAFGQIADALVLAERDASWPAPRPAPDGRLQVVLAFFEAYFSNYIEGTIFPIDEARRIVFEGEIPVQRPEDAHDVLGTYQLAIDEGDARRVPESAGDVLAILAERHRALMAERPSVGPGEVKRLPNQAGGYLFVDPELVVGTLEQAYPLIAGLATPLARAAMTMFVVSEVHPFADGNGRVARLAMNAELSAAGECRIVIPVISRNDYLSALRRCSLHHDPALLVRVLADLQAWTAAMDWGDLAVTTRLLEETNALVEPFDAEGRHLYLRRPDEVLSPGTDLTARAPAGIADLGAPSFPQAQPPAPGPDRR